MMGVHRNYEVMFSHESTPFDLVALKKSTSLSNLDFFDVKPLQVLILQPSGRLADYFVGLCRPVSIGHVLTLTSPR
jgi:hypothetical protein